MRALGAALALIVATAATPAHAEEPKTSFPLGEAPSPEPEDDDPKEPPPPKEKQGYWGPNRWFMAAEADFGFLYVRPRASFGYGQPFRRWLGAEVNPVFSLAGPGAYGGFRFRLPVGDMRIGARYRSSIDRTFLVKRPSYDIIDIERREGNRSSYVTVEAQIEGALPWGPGALLGQLTGSAVLLVDDGFWVFEETIRAVIAPPWAWRARTGYGMRFMNKKLTMAPLLEVLGIPGRGAFVLRGGAVAAFRVKPTLQVRAIAVPTLKSVDKLGTAGADAYLIGVRWRWATDVPLRDQLPAQLRAAPNAPRW